MASLRNQSIDGRCGLDQYLPLMRRCQRLSSTLTGIFNSSRLSPLYNKATGSERSTHRDGNVGEVWSQRPLITPILSLSHNRNSQITRRQP